MRPKVLTRGNEKAYDYDGWISRIRLPDYCPKCHSRDGIYLSHDEDGMDILRCGECHYAKLSPTIKV